MWERSIVPEGPHSFCPAQGYVECSRTSLFPFQVTRINNQVMKHVGAVKSGLKTLKFVYGCCPRNFQRTPSDSAAPLATERSFWLVLARAKTITSGLTFMRKSDCKCNNKCMTFIWILLLDGVCPMAQYMTGV